jgi:hypothetical protein
LFVGGLAHILGYMVSSLPWKYLGLPFGMTLLKNGTPFGLLEEALFF